MKRISFLLVLLLVGMTPGLRAQDAATEERLSKLAGRIEDLAAGQESLRRQIEALRAENASLRERLNRPTSYATAEDLRRIAKSVEKAVEEVDRKRMEDAENVRTELVKLAQKLTAAPPAPPPAVRSHTPPPRNEDPVEKPAPPEQGYEYVIKKGDTISNIIQAYRENNIRVTQDQILKANPKLKPEKMIVGQKIWIPAPRP